MEVILLRVWDPSTLLVPLQPLVALQEVALLLFQVSLLLLFFLMDVGLAVSVRVGAGGVDEVTVTETESLLDPPEPVQVRTKVRLLVKLPVD